MWTDHVERLDGCLAFVSHQIHVTDRLTRIPIPRIRAISDHRELSRNAIVGHGVERRDSQRSVVVRLFSQRVKQHQHAGGEGKDRNDATDHHRRRLSKKVAARLVGFGRGCRSGLIHEVDS